MQVRRLHAQRIAHADLSLDNFLMGAAADQVLLIDFAYSVLDAAAEALEDEAEEVLELFE
jgi:tRNA A-37 threonylcarbamoyl transferase component Bud32